VVCLFVFVSIFFPPPHSTGTRTQTVTSCEIHPKPCRFLDSRPTSGILQNRRPFPTTNHKHSQRTFSPNTFFHQESTQTNRKSCLRVFSPVLVFLNRSLREHEKRKHPPPTPTVIASPSPPHSLFSFLISSPLFFFGDPSRCGTRWVFFVCFLGRCLFLLIWEGETGQKRVFFLPLGYLSFLSFWSGVGPIFFGPLLP